MAQVLDYSAGFPGAKSIRDAGYPGAVRYGGFPGRRKCTTAAELRDFDAHGLGMAIVFEDTETTWRGGYGAGRSGAQRTRNHLNDIGFPQNRPIYMAVDQDVVTTGEFSTMLDFLRGAASVVGPKLIGPYGEADVIDRAREAGLATWAWQTAAWSGKRHTNATLYQHVGTVYVGGVTCDYNDVLAADWGQHNAVLPKRRQTHREEDAMIIMSETKGLALVVGGVAVPLGQRSTDGAVNSTEAFPRLQLTDGEYNQVLTGCASLQSLPGKLDALLAKESGGGVGPIEGDYDADVSITVTRKPSA